MPLVSAANLVLNASPSAIIFFVSNEASAGLSAGLSAGFSTGLGTGAAGFSTGLGTGAAGCVCTGCVCTGAALPRSLSSLGQLLTSTLLTVVLISVSILLMSMLGMLPVADLGMAWPNCPIALVKLARLPSLSILSVEVTLPACSGTTSSGPFSPTQYGTPAFTGPPSARCSTAVLGVAEGGAAELLELDILVLKS